MFNNAQFGEKMKLQRHRISGQQPYNGTKSSIHLSHFSIKNYTFSIFSHTLDMFISYLQIESSFTSSTSVEIKLCTIKYFPHLIIL